MDYVFVPSGRGEQLLYPAKHHMMQAISGPQSAWMSRGWPKDVPSFCGQPIVSTLRALLPTRYLCYVCLLLMFPRGKKRWQIFRCLKLGSWPILGSRSLKRSSTLIDWGFRCLLATSGADLPKKAHEPDVAPSSPQPPQSQLFTIVDMQGTNQEPLWKRHDLFGSLVTIQYVLTSSFPSRPILTSCESWGSDTGSFTHYHWLVDSVSQTFNMLLVYSH